MIPSILPVYTSPTSTPIPTENEPRAFSDVVPLTVSLIVAVSFTVILTITVVALGVRIHFKQKALAHETRTNRGKDSSDTLV